MRDDYYWRYEQLCREYDDMLDECYEPFRMGELIYMPSDILKSCDPIAYRCGVSDFEDMQEEEEEEEDLPETHPRDEHDEGMECDDCELEPLIDPYDQLHADYEAWRDQT